MFFEADVYQIFLVIFQNFLALTAILEVLLVKNLIRLAGLTTQRGIHAVYILVPGARADPHSSIYNLCHFYYKIPITIPS